MAWLGVELLVLLLVSVWGRERAGKMQMFHEAGDWGGTPSRSDGKNAKDDFPEDEKYEIEGVATAYLDSGAADFPGAWVSVPDKRWQVEPEKPPGSNELVVLCTESGFRISFPAGPVGDVMILGLKDLVSVQDAPEFCGYKVNLLRNTLTVPFSGCHADRFSLQLLFVDELGNNQVSTVSCERRGTFNADPFHRDAGEPKPAPKCTNPTSSQNCAVPTEEQVGCGRPGIPADDCEKMGCCVDPSTWACYYKIDECTADQHFVFAIRNDSASQPLDPRRLVIPGGDCKPVIVNEKVAIFKFKVTECGARGRDAGDSKIYVAQVQTLVETLKLKYGVITRDEPLNFVIECSYSKQGIPEQSLASVGCMVKTSSVSTPAAANENGLYGVYMVD